MIYIETKLFQFIIYLLKRNYGADCRTKDTDDFKDLPTRARCGSCRAKETITFLQDHIDLIRD